MNQNENPSVTIPNEEITVFREEGNLMRTQLRSIEVVDIETCELASDILKRRMQWQQRVETRFKPIVAAARNVVKMVADLRDEVLQTGEADAQATRNSRDAFLREQDRLAQEARDKALKAQREADKKAQAEAAERTRNLGGSDEAVKRVAEHPIMTAPPPPPTLAEPSRPKGTYKRSNWKWRPEGTEATAVLAILDAYAKTKDKNYRAMLAGYLTLNNQALNGVATGQKELAQVPGIIVYDDPSYVDRSK